jgi:hypothetical protein
MGSTNLVGTLGTKTKFPDLAETLLVKSRRKSCWGRVRCAKAEARAPRRLSVSVRHELAVPTNSDGCRPPQPRLLLSQSPSRIPKRSKCAIPVVQAYLDFVSAGSHPESLWMRLAHDFLFRRDSDTVAQARSSGPVTIPQRATNH